MVCTEVHSPGAIRSVTLEKLPGTLLNSHVHMIAAVVCFIKSETYTQNLMNMMAAVVCTISNSELNPGIIRKPCMIS